MGWDGNHIDIDKALAWTFGASTIHITTTVNNVLKTG